MVIGLTRVKSKIDDAMWSSLTEFASGEVAAAGCGKRFGQQGCADICVWLAQQA
jgi:hypothetical protein